MHFRRHSEVGWLMLQLMGRLCLPFVTQDAQKRASAKERLTALFPGRAGGKTLDLHAAQRRFLESNWPRAGTDRVTVSDLPQTRSPGPAPSESIAARARRLVEQYPKAKRPPPVLQCIGCVGWLLDAISEWWDEQ